MRKVHKKVSGAVLFVASHIAEKRKMGEYLYQLQAWKRYYQLYALYWYLSLIYVTFTACKNNLFSIFYEYINRL